MTPQSSGSWLLCRDPKQTWWPFVWTKPLELQTAPETQLRRGRGHWNNHGTWDVKCWHEILWCDYWYDNHLHPWFTRTEGRTYDLEHQVAPPTTLPTCREPSAALLMMERFSSRHMPFLLLADAALDARARWLTPSALDLWRSWSLWAVEPVLNPCRTLEAPLPACSSLALLLDHDSTVPISLLGRSRDMQDTKLQREGRWTLCNLKTASSLLAHLLSRSEHHIFKCCRAQHNSKWRQVAASWMLEKAGGMTETCKTGTHWYCHLVVDVLFL